MSAPTATVLERILSETRHELELRKREVPLSALQRAEVPAAQAGRLREALCGAEIGVIAEFKRRSPSAGALHQSPDLAQIVGAYERGGAVAVSILTEGPNFHGELADLTLARQACALPLLRKDFVVDPYQLHEALIAGASAVLLIVAALDARTLASLYTEARAIGLDVLVEVHDRAELDAALLLGANIIGVNNRDLRDFSVDLRRTEALMGHVPSAVAVVSESGIAQAEQLRRLQELGVRGVLVGETLMRSRDPVVALRELRSFRHSSYDI
jgi:indole-3-glycerol phosphate synthase